MKKQKLYIDTSAVAYLDEQTSPKEMKDMLILWDKIKQGGYDVILSEITLAEIYDNLNLEKVKYLAKYLSEIIFDTVRVNDEVRKIADLVKNNGMLVSDKHQNDRLHIGCAVVYGCDILVSLNFKHLVNVRTIKGVRGIASLGGYSSIDILPPAMLIEEGDD